MSTPRWIASIAHAFGLYVADDMVGIESHYISMVDQARQARDTAEAALDEYRQRIADIRDRRLIAHQFFSDPTVLQLQHEVAAQDQRVAELTALAAQPVKWPRDSRTGRFFNPDKIKSTPQEGNQ